MTFKNKTFLVTGGFGFLGSKLIKELLKKDAKVIVISRKKRVLDFKGKNIILIKADLLNLNKLKIKTKIDGIFHLAAKTPFNTKKYSDSDVSQDLLMTKNICSFSLKYNIPKIIFASGFIVYNSKNKIPLIESSNVQPETLYGKAKYLSEKYLLDTLKNSSTKLTILRFSTVYGPTQTSPGVIPNFIKASLANKELNVSLQTVKRDYLHIDDAIDAFILSFQKTSGIYNIGSDKSYSVLNIAESIINEIHRGKIMRVNFAKTLSDNRLNINKSKKILKFKPKISLKEGLKQTIDWNKLMSTHPNRNTAFIDLDGTILDVSHRIYLIYSDIMGSINLATLSNLKRKKIPEKVIVGMTCTNPKKITDYLKKRTSILEDQKYLLLDKLFPKTKLNLKKLRKEANLILLTKRKNISGLKKEIARLEIKELFDDICITQNKTDTIRKHTFYKYTESIIIGDTEEDIVAGKELNLVTVALLTGIRDRSFLQKMHPNYLFKTLEDVAKSIKSILKK